MSKLELTAEQKKVVASFSADERKEFDSYDADGQIAMINLVIGLEADAKALEGKVKTKAVSTTGADEEADCMILRTGGIGLREGQGFTAQLIGSMPILSKKPKENWPTRVFNGETYYVNMFYKFRRTDGTEFGVFDSPTLRILRKVFTHSATPKLVAQDPVVKVLYIGKVEGKDKLKAEYGIDLQKGNSAHVFNVNIEETAQIDRYAKGVVNYLKNPIPTAKASNEEMSDEELAQLNWEQIQRANGVQALGHNPQGQISM